MSDRETRDEDSKADGCSGRSRHHHRRSRRHHGHRKERVLHTRISEQLSEDIKRLADDMRVPVSNLVRNVLEEVFTAVESASGDVGEFFEEVLDEAEGVRERIRKQRRSSRPGSRSSESRRGAESEEVEREFRADEVAEDGTSGPSRPPTDDVLGWQSIVLNRSLVCPDCGASLERGERAHMGVSATGAPGRVVCGTCAGAS
jgi:hypothetical protein